jgi:hypothetical protein
MGDIINQVGYEACQRVSLLRVNNGGTVLQR